MPITQEIEKWLREEGHYEYHCFVSWPRTDNRDLTECATRVKDAVESALADSFVAPRVFIDEKIGGGVDWDIRLKRSICRSISMVAICAPIYYRPEHKWCGLEWASMQQLSDSRLAGQDFHAIIPLMVRMSKPLPLAVSKIQYIDVSRLTLQGRRYYSSPEFRRKIQQIVLHIELIAEELWKRKRAAECDLFQFPTESAFALYDVPVQPFPIVNS